MPEKRIVIFAGLIILAGAVIAGVMLFRASEPSSEKSISRSITRPIPPKPIPKSTIRKPSDIQHPPPEDTPRADPETPVHPEPETPALVEKMEKQEASAAPALPPDQSLPENRE